MSEVGEFVLTGTGQDVRIDPDHRAGKPDVLDALAATAMKMQEHLWVVMAGFHVTKEAMRANAKGQKELHLDSESLVTHGVGCFVCEQPFEPRMLDRRCPGEPK